MKEDKVILQQILFLIEKIEAYIEGITFEEFVRDTKTQDAVIRNIEIIGEAANRLSKDFQQNNPGFPLLETVSMRNRLIHGYDDINLEIVWATATVDVQKLKFIINSL
ncbi:MAG: DUF86 domain-containing protein [bacterium]|nr:DUF86 domain-containing protein [bacterium]